MEDIFQIRMNHVKKECVIEYFVQRIINFNSEWIIYHLDLCNSLIKSI